MRRGEMRCGVKGLGVVLCNYGGSVPVWFGPGLCWGPCGVPLGRVWGRFGISLEWRWCWFRVGSGLLWDGLGVGVGWVLAYGFAAIIGNSAGMLCGTQLRERNKVDTAIYIYIYICICIYIYYI
jgi:hypothetical protein